MCLNVLCEFSKSLFLLIKMVIQILHSPRVVMLKKNYFDTLFKTIALGVMTITVGQRDWIQV